MQRGSSESRPAMMAAVLGVTALLLAACGTIGTETAGDTGGHRYGALENHDQGAHLGHRHGARDPKGFRGRYGYRM